MTSQRFTTKKRKFFNRNFSDVIQFFLPEQYIQADLESSGVVVDPTLDIIKSHVDIANNINSIRPLDPGEDFDSLDTFDGILPFFIKQNNFTQIS